MKLLSVVTFEQYCHRLPRPTNIEKKGFLWHLVTVMMPGKPVELSKLCLRAMERKTGKERKTACVEESGQFTPSPSRVRPWLAGAVARCLPLARLNTARCSARDPNRTRRFGSRCMSMALVEATNAPEPSD